MVAHSDDVQPEKKRNPFSGILTSYFFKIVDRHAPPVTQHLLNRKKLYIYPSKRGHALMVVLLIVWLLGTNYQNNLILGLAFLLTSIFIISILSTHNNLSGLTIEYMGATPTFAGEDIEYIFSLTSNEGHFVENIEIGWQYADDFVVHIDVSPNESIKVHIPQRAIKRGWQKPGRLLVQSYFPLGILRCWSWLNWDVAALVYPEPMASPLPANKSLASDGEGEHPVPGGEDYTGLREYRAGDSLKHIAWKHFAREKGLFVKEYCQNVSQERWLVFDHFDVTDAEEKLSAMCYWALRLTEQDEYFGVVLPEGIIEPDKGENHRRRVLEALAMFKE